MPTLRPSPAHLAAALAAGLCAALPSAPARAAGFDVPSVGAPHSGPVRADAASVWHNPALLARLRRPQLLFGAALLLADLGYTRERLGRYQGQDHLEFLAPVPDSALDPSLTGPAGHVGSTQLLPSVDLFIAAPLTPWLGLGLGLGVPYAAPVRFDDDGPQRFALQSALIAAPHLSVAAGVRLHERVHFGAGLDLIFGTAELKRVQDFGTLDLFGDLLRGPPARQENNFGQNAPTELRELSALARPISITEGRAFNLSFHAGLSIEPHRDWLLSLTYHHGADLGFEGRFALDLNDDFFTQDLSPVGLAYPALIQGDARLLLKLPDRQVFAARWQADPFYALELRLSRVGWSRLDAMRVGLSAEALALPALGVSRYSRSDLPRHWQDSYGASLWGHITPPTGPSYSVNLAYESPASPDETIDAGSPDGHRLGLRALVEWTLGAHWQLAPYAGLQFIVPREVRTSTYDLGNGRYTLLIAQLGLHATFAWGGPTEEPSQMPEGSEAPR